MGNGKNKKRRGSKNPKSGKTRLAGMSTPKQKPTYRHTRSVTRAQHIQATLFAAPIIPGDDEPQGVSSAPTPLLDVTIFNPANLQDLQGAHTLLNLHHTPHHQRFAVAQTPHDGARLSSSRDAND